MKSVIKKAVKKLKFWSKKKSSRDKKRHHLHDSYYTPPPPYHCHGCSSSSSFPTQPSAPPLPVPSDLWLETEHKYSSNTNYGTFLARPEEANNYHASEIVPVPMDPSPVPPSAGDHQYSVSVSEPSPAVVYGIPVVPLIQTPRSRARSCVHFGFVLTFGAYLFQCLCPCFHSHT